MGAHEAIGFARDFQSSLIFRLIYQQGPKYYQVLYEYIENSPDQMSTLYECMADIYAFEQDKVRP